MARSLVYNPILSPQPSLFTSSKMLLFEGFFRRRTHQMALLLVQPPLLLQLLLQLLPRLPLRRLLPILLLVPFEQATHSWYRLQLQLKQQVLRKKACKDRRDGYSMRHNQGSYSLSHQFDLGCISKVLSLGQFQEFQLSRHPHLASTTVGCTRRGKEQAKVRSA